MTEQCSPDIVDRLRDRDSIVLSGLFHAIPTMRAAADEIERQRKMLDRTLDDNEKLRAEIERMRAAAQTTSSADFIASLIRDHIKLHGVPSGVTIRIEGYLEAAHAILSLSSTERRDG